MSSKAAKIIIGSYFALHAAILVNKGVQNDPELAEKILSERKDYSSFKVDPRMNLACTREYSRLSNAFTATKQNGDEVKGCVEYGTFYPNEENVTIVERKVIAPAENKPRSFE